MLKGALFIVMSLTNCHSKTRHYVCFLSFYREEGKRDLYHMLSLDAVSLSARFGLFVQQLFHNYVNICNICQSLHDFLWTL